MILAKISNVSNPEPRVGLSLPEPRAGLSLRSLLSKSPQPTSATSTNYAVRRTVLHGPSCSLHVQPSLPHSPLEVNRERRLAYHNTFQFLSCLVLSIAPEEYPHDGIIAFVQGFSFVLYFVCKNRYMEHSFVSSINWPGN
jgi:hypothetical protein